MFDKVLNTLICRNMLVFDNNLESLDVLEFCQSFCHFVTLAFFENFWKIDTRRIFRRRIQFRCLFFWMSCQFCVIVQNVSFSYHFLQFLLFLLLFTAFCYFYALFSLIFHLHYYFTQIVSVLCCFRCILTSYY